RIVGPFLCYACRYFFHTFPTPGTFCITTYALGWKVLLKSSCTQQNIAKRRDDPDRTRGYVNGCACYHRGTGQRQCSGSGSEFPMQPLRRWSTPQSVHSWWSDSNPTGATIPLHALAKPLMKRLYHRQAIQRHTAFDADVRFGPSNDPSKKNRGGSADDRRRKGPGLRAGIASLFRCRYPADNL
ncbi:hypothetical protein B0H13DRAFT_2021508, partial [Mycena leptocephala]